ncbi:MAG: AzlD domain-containing protein [Vitreoscilla sp.]|nr:AzlD domain-containing protein [Vitreoscilla sp.]MBP6676940.1 AzlD domain-containing protein [Vitreoscilla sp.]
MVDSGYAVAVIVAMGGVTLALRALPFLAAQWLHKHPLVQALGRFLPLAIMTLLLVNAMVGAARSHSAGPAPELLAVALVVLLQWFGRHALLSILVGTGTYVLMRNAGSLSF